MIANQTTTKKKSEMPLTPGDLIKLNKPMHSWWSPARQHNPDTYEPRRHAEEGEVKLLLSVIPLNTQGADTPVTTWQLICLSEHGIEYFRLHKKTRAANFTLLSSSLSDKPTSST